MPGKLTLYDGPAGSGKSQIVREAQAAGEIDIVADLTQLWAAMTGAERGPDGKYPIRLDTDPVINTGMATYIRNVVVRQGLDSGLSVAVTSGTPGKEVQFAEIAASANAPFTHYRIDPGEAVVRARLADAYGSLDPECDKAINRWYQWFTG